jgi:hypothetical protein
MWHIRAVRHIYPTGGNPSHSSVKAHDVKSGFLIVHRLDSYFRSIGSGRM